VRTLWQELRSQLGRLAPMFQVRSVVLPEVREPDAVPRVQDIHAVTVTLGKPGAIHVSGREGPSHHALPLGTAEDARYRPRRQ